jgi:hypothetical protein
VNNKTSETIVIDYVISAFRREVEENYTLLGYYAASSGNFLLTFRDNLSVPTYSLRNNREERSSQRSLFPELHHNRNGLLGNCNCAKNSPKRKKHMTPVH